MHGVSQIEVPDLTSLFFITLQQQVEHHLSKALALWFQLTAGSPFSWTPSAMILDY